MQEFDLLGLNETAKNVYHKHVEGQQNRYQKETIAKTKLSIEDVENILVLSIFGARNIDIARALNITPSIVSAAVRKNTFRDLNLKILKRKYKKLGKMVFEYDHHKVIEHYVSLDDSLKAICKREWQTIDIKDLVVSTKLIKTDYSY